MRGFTLVETLVVVTIIVVLLALLTPAMDQAIYQAELAACATKLDAVGTGLITGATENQRRFPERLARRFLPITVNLPTSIGGGDDRPTIRRYVGHSLDIMLNDPLVKPADIEGSLATTWIQTSYAMWFTWRTGPGESSMRKLGDRWTWRGQSFNILAQDYEGRVPGGPYHFSSHPDGDNVMWNYHVKDSSSLTQDLLNGGGETSSMWLTTYGVPVGAFDYNILDQGGAVHRLSNLIPKYTEGTADPDERTMLVPGQFDEATPIDQWWLRVPKP